MTTEHDTDDLDFAMLSPLTRPGPCKAATVLEVDPVEARLEREVQAAPHIAKNVGLDGDHDNAWQAGKCAYSGLGSYDGKVCEAMVKV